MELKKLSNQELLGRLDKLVRTERKLTHAILSHINEVESRRLYAELGFDSMFKYLTHHCGYGEDSAYRRLQAARLLRKNPEIAEKLEEGTLNLTQLTQVQKCLRQEQQSGGMVSPEQTLQILEQIENKSSYETKRVLALEFNQHIQAHEVIKPQRDESVRLEVTFTQEQMKVLEHAKELLSHTLPEGSWADVITYLAEKQVQKILGSKKSSRKSNQNNISSENPIGSSAETEKVHLPLASSTPSFTTKRKRAHMRIAIRRRVLQKARHCCEFVDPKTQRRCQSTYQVQIDHKRPLARGGTDEEYNLRALCRTHNLLAAKHWGL